MALKAIVDSLDDVEEGFRSLYVEKNGKYEISGIEGMRTQGDVDRLQAALVKERSDHKAVREKFSAFHDLDLADVLSKLDKYGELEEAAKGKLDDAKIEDIVSKRLSSKLSPVERERESLKKQLAEANAKVQEYQSKELRRTISDKVREAANGAKLLPEAVEDALLLGERVFEVSEDGRVVTRDNVGVTPGIDPAVWLTELQTKRPHWWGKSVGGGAAGSRSSGGQPNPWSAEGWNMTEQGRILTADRNRAEQLAKSAGTTIGGKRPVPRK